MSYQVLTPWHKYDSERFPQRMCLRSNTFCSSCSCKEQYLRKPYATHVFNMEFTQPYATQRFSYATDWYDIDASWMSREVLAIAHMLLNKQLLCPSSTLAFHWGCHAALSKLEPKPFRWNSGWTKSCMTSNANASKRRNQPYCSLQYGSRYCLSESFSRVALPQIWKDFTC